MRTKLVIILAVLVIALIAVPAAQAYTWSHVGGDPLVPGGVWSDGDFSYLMLNSSKVRTALSYVRSANGQPKWVLPNAYDAVAKGKIHTGSVPMYAHLGAMSYGRNTIRVVKNTVYAGQYNPLPIFHVVSSKTTTVKIDGKYFRQTTSYRVSMAKPCGNVFIYKKTVTRKRLWELRVEKRLDTISGERLAGWQITGTVGGKDKSLTTKSTGSVLVGRYLAGTKYNLSEVLTEGWEIVSPEGGNFAGKMPKKNLTLKFVNREPCAPIYKLYVQKQEDCSFKLLAGWVISGNVGGAPVSVTTVSTGSTLVGEYVEGTSYSLSETLKDGWEIVSPANGNFTGQMPAHDLTLTFVNKPYNPPPPPPDEYCLFVRKVNADGGALIGGWGISGTLAGQEVSKSTSASGWVLVGALEEGESYFLSEETRENWFPVSPTTGYFSGVMGTKDVYLTFSNRYSPPEPQEYCLFVEVREDSTTGPRLSNWTVQGYGGGSWYSVLSSSSDWIRVDCFEEGTVYDFSIVMKDGWQLVSPSGGRYTGTMPNHNVYLTYVVRRCPPPSHELSVRGEVSPLEHVDQGHLSVTLDAIVLTHTDGDSLNFSWYVNGVRHDTILTSYYILLEYETVYNVTLVATDKLGHTAQYTLAPFNFTGPGEPPPPPPD